MAEFTTPFAGLQSQRILTHRELIRSLRQLVAAEYEAANMYQQLVDSINDPVAKKIIADVAEEELVHVGEFIRVIKYLNPKEESFYVEGEKEAEEVMKSGDRTDQGS